MLGKQSCSSHIESIDEYIFSNHMVIINKENRNMCFFSKTIKKGIYFYQPHKVRRGKRQLEKDSHPEKRISG